jgi:hypothetical protein
MKVQPVLEEYRGRSVWVNPTTEAARQSECLCLNCDSMRPDSPNHCRLARVLYMACVPGDLVVMVTRCSSWKPRS